MARNYANDGKLLVLLMEEEGFGQEEEIAFMEEFELESVQPGICATPGCEYINSRLEPDQDQGWCEECEAGTCVSAGILLGIC